MKRAQMFVITMVFLVGLIFVVQQGFIKWFSYSIDFSAQMQRDDYYLFDNVKTMAERTLKGSQTCDEAIKNLQELKNFLHSRILSSYFLEFTYRLECSYWGNSHPNPAPLNVTIHITGEDTDTAGNFFLYRF